MHHKTILAILGIALAAGCQYSASEHMAHRSSKAAGSQWMEPHERDLWDRMREGFRLPYDDSDPRIAHYIQRYGRYHDHILTLANRAAPMQFLIVEAVEKRNMPLEIALLPMVESALDPFADSHGEAAGIWQIIPSTATLLGLQRDWWYDARRDIVASTEAALDYLTYLHQRFDGQWLLALAAYNSGEGTVSRAILRNKKAGKPTDFHSLRLPKETRDYVPKLLALVHIIKSPQAYDLALPSLPNAPHLRTVEIDAQIDLAFAAELSEIPLTELYRLNSAYNRWATHPDAVGPHQLLLPIDNAELLEEKITYADTDEWVNWNTYHIRPGDTLAKIASENHTTIDVLRTVNRLESDQIIAGRYLMIPVPAAPYARYAASKQKCTASGCSRNRHIIHTVKNGESLWTIGKKYRVKVEDLIGWNQLEKAHLIKPGQRLIVKSG